MVEPSAVPVEERVQQYVASGRWKPMTRKAYADDLRMLTQWCASEQIDVLYADHGQMLRFFHDLATNTIGRHNRVRGTAGGFYDMLVARGVRQDNPVTGIARLPENKQPRGAISLDELQAMLQAATS